MKPYDVFKMYKALSLHFSEGSYDYFKYKGRVKGTEAAFENRNDKYFFNKLSQKENISSFLLANLSIKNYYVLDLINSDECQNNYTKWAAFRKAYTYEIKSDFKKFQTIGEMSGLYRKGELNKESVALLIKANPKILDDINTFFHDDIIWNYEMKITLEKYVPFVPKQDKYLKLALDKLEEMKYNA